MQRMRAAPRVLRGLAEHRAELGRPPLGDMAVTIALTAVAVFDEVERFGSAKHVASYAGLVPSTYQSADRDDRADAGDCLEPADIVTEAAPEISEEMIHG